MIGTDRMMELGELDVVDFDERYSVYACCRKSACYGNVKSFLDFLKGQGG